MKKSFLVLFLLAISTFVIAQAPPPTAVPANGEPAKISPGSLLPVELAKTVDAKKAKSGDPVVGKIPHDLSANGKVVIPQDTKVIGHVAEVKPSNHDSKDSKLGIVFDKISMKDGAEIPLAAEIQAVGAPVQMASAAYDNNAPPPQSNPAGTNQASEMGGHNTAPTPQSQPDQSGGMPSSVGSSNPPLTGQSQGVVGLKGYSLAQGMMQDSVISSQEHNVKLESGTQILLKTK